MSYKSCGVCKSSLDYKDMSVIITSCDVCGNTLCEDCYVLVNEIVYCPKCSKIHIEEVTK